jgi:hypothetical protein
MHGTKPLGYLGDEFLDRVRRSYRLALNVHGQDGDKGPVWQPIEERRADVHAALVSSDNAELRRIFADPVSTDLYYGTDGICRSIFGRLQNDCEYREGFAVHVRGLIKDVAKAMGLPEADDPDFSIARMDDLLLQRVEFPSPFDGEIGLETARGLATERSVRALYEIFRVLKLLGSDKLRRIVEIGPGVGRTALYGYRAGLDYTTVDLPLGMVAQACFLGAVLGPDRLWFEGENDIPPNDRIKILAGLPSRLFDVAVNADSMTEMPLGVAIDYVIGFKRNVPVFMSINHSKNLFTVAEIFAITRAGHLRKRQPCPMWPGYSEDVYDMTPADSLLMPVRVRAFRGYIGARAKLRQASRWLVAKRNT